MDLKFNAVFQITAGELKGVYRFILEDRIRAQVCVVQLDGHANGARQQTGRAKSTATKRPRKAPALPLVGDLLWLDSAELLRLRDRHQLHAVEVEPDAVYLRPLSGDHAQTLFARRKQAMASFLHVDRLQEGIAVHGGLGGLVREAMQVSKLSRAAIYKNWSLLCRYGITELSLRPRLDQCGARNVARPCDPGGRHKAGRKTNKQRLGAIEDTQQKPEQPGMSTAWRAMIMAADATIPSPKPRMSERCSRIIASQFVTRYKQIHGELVAIDPEQGQYPNVRQIRRVLEHEIPRLQRLLESTTQGHFDRNKRGLSGKSWKGVAGPGHTWAVDSTIGDIYLRSSLNRVWVIGRPIVYVLVDVWSTAVVGFYVCLQGPSWAMAKLGLFCAGAAVDLLGSLWGFASDLGLSPAPTLSAILLCDRGEYLSRAASLTGVELLPILSYAPPYRPDYKGIVEVLHRIEKDRQYYFVPGALDARRAEYEKCKFDPSESVLTMREFVQFLYVVFREYNLTADRTHRLDAHMKAAAVVPSPAGLWRWGHGVGIGFQRSIPKAQLISSLLPTSPARVQRSGVKFAGLDYSSPGIGDLQWTAKARNFGGWELPCHYFPGAVRRIWTPNPAGAGMLELDLMDQSNASPELTLDEVIDAHQYNLCRNAQTEHSIAMVKLQSGREKREIVEGARRRTAEAIAQDGGPTPTLTEARTMEIRDQSISPTTAEAPQPTQFPIGHGDEAEESHNATMQRILASLNKVGGHGRR